MRVAIVEDNPNIVSLIKTLLKEYQDPEIVGHSDTVQDAINLIDREKPDVVFFDIELKDGLSFEIFNKIKFKDFKCVFITSFEDYALKAFRLSAIDYITKPIDPDLFYEALNKVKKQIKLEEQEEKLDALLFNVNKGASKDARIVINSSNNIHAITISDIVRLESEGGYTELILSSGKTIFTSKSLSEYVDLLKDHSFLRTHQSHLVNFDYFDNYSKKRGVVVLSNDEQIPVSSRNQEKILKLIKDLS
ncbi:MAG: LytTR family DNA-binding domain-containing protein [Flavobacteriales bacterium]|nr:LytTR family DNA-binding domain-containing protein [Flavobacteriales bacterium]